MWAMRFGMIAGVALLGACATQPEGGASDGAAGPGVGPGIAQTVTPPAQEGADQPMQCNADAVQKVIGQEYTDALGEVARTESGSRSLRVMRPGQAMTMDYRIDRLNLELDAGNRVVSARCG